MMTLTALMLMSVTIWAVPAKPGVKKIVTLADGSVVELTLKGDEHFSYYTDAKGQPCLVVDGRLQLMSREDVSKQWSARKQERLRFVKELQANRAARRVGDATETTTGTHKGLVILVQYKDKSFVTKNPQQAFYDFFNAEGYNNAGMSGSVRDYFKEQSYDQLTIDFDVYGPYTLKNDMAYYGKPVKDKDGKVKNHDEHPTEMVAEAIDAAHDAGVDFSKYDWSKGGNVDQVFVVYAGYAEAQGADENTIWPHEWYLSYGGETPRTYNGVKIDKYGCTAELRGNGVDNPGILDGIGTACHEFSHCLGLPDMYDTSDGGTNYGTGYWDVMCSGSYNNDSCTPAGYTSYERWFSKWITPVELNSPTSVKDMQPLATKGKAYILYNDKNKNEYYMLENRQPIGFDTGLYGHGLLILHVDYDAKAWSGNKVNDEQGHERMRVIAADNEYDSRTASSIAGDIWPGTSGNTMLTNFTTPAASLFNANSDGSKFLNKAIDHITENVEAKTVSFDACGQQVDKPDVENTTTQSTENTLTLTWPAVTGATGYEVEFTRIKESDIIEARQREFDFHQFESSSVVMKQGGDNSSLTVSGFENWYGNYLYATPKKLRIGSALQAGRLQTPSSRSWEMPSSGNMTVVVGADIVDEPVTCYFYLYYVTSTGSNWEFLETKVLTINGNASQLVYFTNLPAGYYCMIIAPENQIYLNYLAFYDGIWTADRLGLGGSTPSAISRRALSTETFNTTTNSVTFNDMVTGINYFYRVRTKGDENIYSPWSDEIKIEFTATGIQEMDASTGHHDDVRYYDLQGREVNGQTKGLLIRKQGNDVKKIIVR